MTVTAAVNAVRVVEAYGTNQDGQQRRFTVAAGTDIPKGSLLKFADPRTASQSAGTGDLIAGVSAMDKEGDDPSTEISVYTNGIFEFTASGSITAGDNVKSAVDITTNSVMTAGDTSTATSTIIGYALKDQTTGLRVQVRMNI